MKVLLQERLRHDPWKMLVGCVLLNLTHVRQVNPIIDGLFEEFPTPETMACADPDKLAGMLRPLGMHNKRAVTLIRLSRDYMEKGTSDPLKLYGVGRYAMDSWRIFQLGMTDIEVTDKELAAYLEGLRRERG